MSSAFRLNDGVTREEFSSAVLRVCRTQRTYCVGLLFLAEAEIHTIRSCNWMVGAEKAGCQPTATKTVVEPPSSLLSYLLPDSGFSVTRCLCIG